MIFFISPTLVVSFFPLNFRTSIQKCLFSVCIFLKCERKICWPESCSFVNYSLPNKVTTSSPLPSPATSIWNVSCSVVERTVSNSQHHEMLGWGSSWFYSLYTSFRCPVFFIGPLTNAFPGHLFQKSQPLHLSMKRGITLDSFCYPSPLRRRCCPPVRRPIDPPSALQAGDRCGVPPIPVTPPSRFATPTHRFSWLADQGLS